MKQQQLNGKGEQVTDTIGYVPGRPHHTASLPASAGLDRRSAPLPAGRQVLILHHFWKVHWLWV